MAKTKRTAVPQSKAKTAYGLLSEIRKLILAEPLRYNQHLYIEHRHEIGPISRRFPSCGTVGCVAGWVATLKSKRRFAYEETPSIAASILGLDDGQQYDLFGGLALRCAAKPAQSAQTVAHAKAGAAHIRRFQEKYKRQLKRKAV